MVMGIKYFCHSFRPRGDLLVVDSLLFYPMLFFIGLAILFLFDIWTKLNCVAPRLYDAKGFAHMHSQEKCIWVNMKIAKLEPGSSFHRAKQLLLDLGSSKLGDISRKTKLD